MTYDFDSAIHTLLRIDGQYSKLIDQWKSIREHIQRGAGRTNLNSYSVEGKSDDDEILIRVFGISIAMTFRHDCKHGYVDYNAVRRRDDGVSEVWVPVATVGFERSGSLLDPFGFYSVDEYHTVHLAVLAWHVQDLIKAADGKG